MNVDPLSVQYLFVRGRQLEGTFPGDASTGTWPITCLRIMRGWGVPPEEAWPYNGDASAWPPLEPPGVDTKAKPNRCGRYQRARTLQECKTVLGLMWSPLIVSLDITGGWANPTGGRIPPLSPDNEVIGSHCVLVEGYDDLTGEFKFANSWGGNWGDRGFGYISYETFQATFVEAWMGDVPECWFRDWPGNKASAEKRLGAVERGWAVGEHGGGTFHCREFVDAHDDRMAWAFAIERSGMLEVEEFFVRPQFRRAGLGKHLVRSIQELATERGCSLKFWISFPDAAEQNLEVFGKLIQPLGLHIGPSSTRFAPLVAVKEANTEGSCLSDAPRAESARPMSPFQGWAGTKIQSE